MKQQLQIGVAGSTAGPWVLAGLIGLASADLAAQGLAPVSTPVTMQDRASYALTSGASAVALDERGRAANWTRLGAELPTGLDVALKNGLYLGAWGAGIRPSRLPVAIDADRASAFSGVDSVYAGYRGEISKKLWVDVGVQRFGALGNRLVPTPGLPNVGQFEAQSEMYSAVTWGLFTAKYARNTTQLQGAVTPVAGQYLDFSANFNLGNGFSLSPRVGRQDMAAAGLSSGASAGLLGFTDYSLTLGKAFANGVALSVTALGTSAGQSLYLVPGNDFSSRIGLAAGLKYAF